MSLWPTKKLGECVDEGLIELKRGDVISQKDMEENPGPYPVYSSSIQKNGLFGKYGKYMFNEELVTWSVDGGGNFFYRSKHKFSVTNVGGILKLRTNKLILKFVYYLLSWQHSQLDFDYIKKAHPSVIKELYYIFFPPLPIQQKIVEILDAVRGAVETQEKIIELTKELKKSLMVKLFREGAPSFSKGRKLKKTEIGEIPEDWEIIKLSNPEIFEIQTGLWKGKTPPFIQVKVIRNTNFKDGKLFLDDVAELEVEASQFQKCKLWSGDILLERSGGGPDQPVGRVVYFDLNIPRYSFGNFLSRIRVINKDKIIPECLFRYLDYFYQKGGTLSLQERTTGIRNLRLRDYLQIGVSLPPLPEQREIAEILQTIDQKIEIEQKKKALYEELFGAMLNKLMSSPREIEKL